jgi:hypothetical protein
VNGCVKANKKIQEDIRPINQISRAHASVKLFAHIANCTRSSFKHLVRWMRREKISMSGELPAGSLINVLVAETSTGNGYIR